MKPINFHIISCLVTIYMVTLTGCNKPGDSLPSPALPPAISIEMAGLSNFSSREKSESANIGSSHYKKAWKFVHVWDSTAISYVNTPKSLFKEVLNGKTPVYNKILDQWTWTYYKTIAGNGEFEVILTAKDTTDSIHWTMTVSSINNSELTNFVWLEGQTDNKQTGGWWKLYESFKKKPYLMINWGKTSDAIAWIQYTNIFETSPEKSNSIKYATSNDTLYNEFFNIFSASPEASLTIEWNKTTFAGALIYEGYIYGWDSNLNSLVVIKSD